MIDRIFNSFLRAGFGAVLWLLPAAAPAHETWLEPQAYQAEVGLTIGIDIVNGQHFNGVKLPWLDRGIERFVAIDTARPGAAERALTGRLGDRPAVQLPLPEAGLVVVAMRSGLDRLVYADWAKFEAFVTEKALSGTLEAHRARGLPDTGFAEVYRRYAKALIAVHPAPGPAPAAGAPPGGGQVTAATAVTGADRALGLETEFVALVNPYARDFDGQMRALLLSEGAPRAKARVTVFQRAPDGQVSEQVHQTDAAGVVRLPVLAGHTYLLDAVEMRPAPAQTDAVWLSRWAALSFAVPAR